MPDIFSNISGTTKPIFNIGKDGISLSGGKSTPPSLETGALYSHHDVGLKLKTSTGWQTLATTAPSFLMSVADSNYAQAKALSALSPLSFNPNTATLSLVNDPVINGTGGIAIPHGTTSERVSPARDGDIRSNSTTGHFEGYANSNWAEFARIKTFSFVRADIAIDSIVFTHDLGNVPVIAMVFNSNGQMVNNTLTWGNNTVRVYFGLSVLTVLTGTLRCIVIG